MEKTACDGLPGKTAKEIELGTLDENINWSCTDEVNGGSVCTKTCGANHFAVEQWNESFVFRVSTVYLKFLT